MTKRLTLFTLFGFEVRMHSSWILLALLVAWSLAVGYFPSIHAGLTTGEYWMMGLLGVIGLFVSIVFHEFFHSVVARYYKMPMKGITLFIFGGIAEMGEEPPTPKAEGFMAIAGPISSLFLWLFFGVIAAFGLNLNWPESMVAVLVYLSQINLILAIFNMVPAFPLDGGRVLRSILWAIRGDIRWATRWASHTGSLFGFILLALGFIGLFSGQVVASIWYILLGLFINFMARASYSQIVMQDLLKDESLRRFIEPVREGLSPELNVQQALDDYFYKYRRRLFPVKEGDHLVGCVSVQQLREVKANRRSQVQVREIMEECSQRNTILPSANAWEAFQKMGQEGLSVLLVVEEEKIIGQVTRQDLTEFLSLKLEVEEGRPSLIST